MDMETARSARWVWRGLLLGATALCAFPALAGDQSRPAAASAADPLAEAFRDPPQEARPRVWWHWVNGNITEDGIAKDLAWMKRVGLGGAQTFDANLQSPQIVDKRLVYMTPEWKSAFRVAASEADRLGLELAIASSPGWSETGGPWVKPEDGMKKLVWSEVEVGQGRPLPATLPTPPAVTGPFQSIVADTGTNSTINDKGPPLPAPHYRDVAVLAFPVKAPRRPVTPSVTDGAGKAIDAAPLVDDDLQSVAEVAKAKPGPTIVNMRFPTAESIRTVSLFVPGGAGKFLGANLQVRLEARMPDGAWRAITDIPLTRVPTTLSFAPVKARDFRMVFNEKSALPNVTPPAPGLDLSGLASNLAGAPAAKSIAIADLRLSTEGRIDRFEAKAGYDIVPDFHALSDGLADDPGVAPQQVIDLTSRLKPDGSLDWRPPRGNWRIVRMGYSLIGTMNHPAPREATGLEVDKYDAAAVRRYLDHYIGMYKDAAGPELVGRRGVRALLNDSIEVGMANWTPGMADHFKRLRGYDPTPWLPALTGTIVGSRALSNRFLFDFRRTLADLLASEHYGTVAKVAHENDLIVYGEALEDHRPLLGDDMAMRSHADIPMGAMWAFPRASGPKKTYIADIKGAASVANIHGRKYVAAESLTSMLAPWAYGPAELKRMIDLEFAIGVNRPVIHTSVHVPTDTHVPGLRIWIFGQDFNRNEAWAELARPWVDYIARNSLMLQQGRHVADIAYFHGEEGPLTELFGGAAITGLPGTNDYDFVNADALLNVLSNDGGEIVTTGGARYRALYLGGASQKMSLRVLRKVAQLAEGGATIVGARPQEDPGMPANRAEYDALLAKLWPGTPSATVGRGRVIATNDLAAALQQAGIAPDFQYSGGQADSDIRFLHRRLDDGDSYFLTNQKDRTETITARFRVTGKAPELWRAETGRSEPVSYAIENGETVVPLELGPDESVHVVFRKPASAPSAVVEKPQPVELAALKGSWHVAFQPGRGAPASVTLPELIPLDKHDDPGVRYFSGIATYTKSFKAPRGWRHGQPLILDLGEAREIAEVTVNGQPAGFAWHSPYRVDIGPLVKAGGNRLQIRVANLWVNRLIGDAQPGAQKITWTASATYRKDAPLRPSGIIGPVRLLGTK